MSFEINYLHERNYAEVQSWPVDVLVVPLVMACLNYVRSADRELVGGFIVFCRGRK